MQVLAAQLGTGRGGRCREATVPRLVGRGEGAAPAMLLCDTRESVVGRGAGRAGGFGGERGTLGWLRPVGTGRGVSSPPNMHQWAP